MTEQEGILIRAIVAEGGRMLTELADLYSIDRDKAFKMVAKFKRLGLLAEGFQDSHPVANGRAARL